MSTRPDPEYAVGDSVRCVGDNIDGSWEGAEGTIKSVEWNDGDLFAGPRWIYTIEWDDEAGMRSEEELDSSDDFEIEPA
jgi:hypothetical protein